MLPPVEPGLGDDLEVTLAVPEIRDYRQVNALLIQALNAGSRFIRLAGVERQRLLCADVSGPWHATVVIDGDAGPEVAAGLDAPGLRVIVTGSADDGAGRGFLAGQLLILGSAGDCVGYGMRGGSILVQGRVGSRAGLDQWGGDLFLAGDVGRLAAERQRGGLLMLHSKSMPGAHFGHGRSGGRLVLFPSTASTEDSQAFERIKQDLAAWLEDSNPLQGRGDGEP